MNFSIVWFAIATLIFLVIQSIPRPLVADEITWMVTNWPPYRYKENAVHKGYGTEWDRLIQKELPEYKHKILIANYARIDKSFREKQNICAMGLYKNETREKHSYFTLPSEFYFPILIFMRKKTHQELGSPAILAFKSIVEDQERKLGIGNGRAYNSLIRQILDEHKGQKNIRTYSHSNIGMSLMRMLVKNRIDYHLEFLIEGKYLAEKIGARDKVVAVMIENLESPLYAWTACSKSEWGLKARNAINRALLKVRPTEAYRSVFEKWLDPHLLPVYRKAYDADFLTAD